MLTSNLTFFFFFEIRILLMHIVVSQQNLTQKNLVSFTQLPIHISNVLLRQECGKIHSKLNREISWRFWLLFLSSLPSHPGHKQSGKSITSFNQEFMETLNILSVKQVLLFSITMRVKYNAVLVVLHNLAKILDLQVFFGKGNPHKDFCQISKVSTGKTESENTVKRFNKKVNEEKTKCSQV